MQQEQVSEQIHVMYVSLFFVGGYFLATLPTSGPFY